MDVITQTKPKLNQEESPPSPNPLEGAETLEEVIKESWNLIAPFWPLKSLIAVNPLQGLEEMPIEEALIQGSVYFQQQTFPPEMEGVNRETIKWLQAFFDEGQSTFPMPLKGEGLFAAWKKLAEYDEQLHGNDPEKIKWLANLPHSPKETLVQCLGQLRIPREETAPFLKMALTTMAGWASYIKYMAEWSGEKGDRLQLDYLAVRIAIMNLLWPTGRDLLQWNHSARAKGSRQESPLKKIEQSEKGYRSQLLKNLSQKRDRQPHTPEAQLVFCIDVRSEPFRRALESTGDYETFGFAGFFGVPIHVTDAISGESYPSCPVLLSPKHEVTETPHCTTKEEVERDQSGYALLTTLKRLYQSVKYTFATPFAMAESIGAACGAWLGLKTLSPNLAKKLKGGAKGLLRKPLPLTPALEAIPFEDQCAFAEGALRMMGLTDHFAPLVVFCGHGSSTENNAYASALDCGACGGHHGCSNARTLAKILNRPEVRNYLKERGIAIPKATEFIGGKHNTTTDEVILYRSSDSTPLEKLQADLEKAREINTAVRLKKMARTPSTSDRDEGKRRTTEISQDWAEVRPEWGLARNAAFIVGPRALTQSHDLEGRCFLHSYDHTQDPEGKYLETILTAPMVVAQWINAQYLFSTLDNVAYGGGSKITKNITGKIGIMQGNASDLMTGLPLQSVYASDTDPYHEPQRLMTIVYAPTDKIDPIIQAHPILQKLFQNGWVQLVALNPQTHTPHTLQRDLTWKTPTK